MKVLVSGGEGFLGSALCLKLSSLGHSVLSFDNLSRASHQNSKNNIYKKHIGDIRNIGELKNACHNFGKIDYFYHLAYINGTSSFYSDPDKVLDVGVKGAINSLDTCLDLGIKNYLLVSTSEVYNEPTQIPTTEKERILIPDIHNPRFSYSGGKIISELLSIHYGAKRGLNVKIVRPHNIYGPNMGFEHVIPHIIKKILLPQDPKYTNNKLIVNIQGTGNETRSFCYIDDAINEIELISNIESLENAPIYNVGVEDEISISKLTHMISKILNIDIEVVVGDKSVGSSNRRCPSMSKMYALGFKNEFNLENGLKKTIEWYKKFYLEGKNE